MIATLLQGAFCGALFVGCPLWVAWSEARERAQLLSSDIEALRTRLTALQQPRESNGRFKGRDHG
jgi:hypothetical protein